MSFGPVNVDGGERRLNVLFTRARVRCEIFASFDPGDIDLSRVSQEGPRILKRFLVGANHRQLTTQVATDEISVVEMPDNIERQMPRYVRAAFPVQSAVEPHEADRSLLARLAIRIIEAEGPIHLEEIARRIAASFGRERAGSRILSATREALDYAQRLCPELVTEASFWFTRRQSEAPPVRDRTAEDGATLKASNISLLEIRAAIKIAHGDNAGGDDTELIRTVARLLGFRRVGSELQARLAQGLEATGMH